MTQPETGRNDHRPPDGLDPAPVDEPCRVVVVPLASGQSVTVSMRSVAPLTGEEEAALGEIVRAAAARMEREHPHAGVITALMQASLRSRVVLRAAGEGDLADRLGAAIRSASEVIRSAWVSGVASSLKSTPEDLTQAAGDSGPGGVTRREEIAQAILAWFHDGSTTEWPGEIDAYRSLAGHLLAAGGVGADRDSRFRWAEEAARLEAELDAERLAHAGTQGERDAGDDFAKGVREWLDVPDEPGWGLDVRDRIAELRADAATSDASLDYVRTSLVEHMDLASELSLPDVLAATWSVVDERDAARASLMAATERGDAEARAVNSLREDLRQARAEAVRVMEHGEKSAANLRAELGRARAERGLYLDAAVAYSVQVAELKAELAGLRERAVEVQKYWRDWPSERRAKVHALSRFLAGAIEDLAVTVESWRAAPEPTSVPVSLDRDPDVPSSVEAPQPDANAGVPCFIISGPMLEDDPIRWLRCSRDKGHPGEHSHIEDRQDGEITWGWLHSLESPYRADYVDGRNNPHRPRDTDDPSEDGIGVWRQDDPEDGGYIFRKTGLVDRPDGPWLSPYTGEYLTNEEMRGCRRISVTFAPAETESVAAPESTNAPAIQFDAAKGAFFRLVSDNHLDPSSVLSLHWVGDDIHLRIQHEGEDQYAVVALNLGDRTDLVNALSQQRTVPNV